MWHGYCPFNVKYTKIMNHIQSTDIAGNFPSISIVIPFQPKMKTKKGFNLILWNAINLEEKELMKKCSEIEATKLIEKLHNLATNLHYKANKSVAIFVSSVISKVYYFKHSDIEMSNYQS
jgi:hypothetical protein